MLKGNRKFIFFLAIALGLLIFVQLVMPKPVNWYPTFSKRHKIPYGSYILFDYLEDIFPARNVITAQDPIYNILHNRERESSNYIVINESFQPDELDTEELLQFVEQGNNVFIASSYFYGDFSDTLHIGTQRLYWLPFSPKDTAYSDKDTLRVNFTNAQIKQERPYEFRKGVMSNYFYSFDSTRTTVLGEDEAGNVNFIKLQWGDGAFYLSSLPRLFTNYHLVFEESHDYAYKALSYLPVADVIWDEYYKIGRPIVTTPIRFLLTHPSLRLAYWFLLISVIIYVLVGIKRRQRFIRVIRPFRNTTLDFVDTVGSVYFQAGNHANIAKKKITYFYEYIRNRFHVKTDTLNESLFQRLANLSAVPQEEVATLFHFAASLQGKSTVSADELIQLNTLIEEFQSKSKR